MRLLIVSLVVSGLIPSVAEAQLPSSQAVAEGTLEVTLSSTLLNSYSRGNLDIWWAEQTGTPGRKVDQGSPAFFALEGRYIIALPDGKGWLAPGIGIIFPADHALWGTSIFFGGSRRLVMQPAIASFHASMIIPLEQLDGATAEFGGGLLIGWVSGEYLGNDSGGDFDNKISRSPGLGFALTGGANYMINDMFGLSVKSGLRFLKAGMSTAGTDYFLDNGDKVKASLSGFYLTIGITLRPEAIMGARK